MKLNCGLYASTFTYDDDELTAADDANAVVSKSVWKVTPRSIPPVSSTLVLMNCRVYVVCV